MINLLKSDINSILKNIEKLFNDTHYTNNLTLKDINGNLINDNTKEIFVNIQFNDCLKNKDSYYKDEHFKSCDKSYLFNYKYDDLFNLLKNNKVGFIEINKYEKGTQVGFVVKKDGFDINDNIEITSPGISKTIMTIGKEYYITYIEKGMVKDSEFYINNKPKKLLGIKYTKSNGYQYEFIFENCRRSLEVFTRKHIKSKDEIIHRIDYHIVETSKINFIKNIIIKCGQELEPLETEDAKILNKPIFEALKEVTSEDF